MDKKEAEYLLQTGFLMGFVAGIVVSILVYYLFDTVFGWA